MVGGFSASGVWLAAAAEAEAEGQQSQGVVCDA
jgi:hypothetical protein